MAGVGIEQHVTGPATARSPRPDAADTPALPVPAAEDAGPSAPLLVPPAASGALGSPSIRIVATHLVGIMLVQSTWMGSQFVIPVLARKQFAATDGQTLLLTMAPTAFFALSIFWNDLFRRMPMGRYLMVFWLVGSLPMGFMALATDFWSMFIPFAISCLGVAGIHPAAGELLKSLYPDAVRGRIYAVIWGVSAAIGAGAGFGVGKWLNSDDQAFRAIMPLAAAAQLVGVLTLGWLWAFSGWAARQRGVLDEQRAAAGPRDRSPLARVRALLAPVGHMGQILRQDPTFARYEAAYMTYGVGWMIAAALVPLVATKKLNLSYDQFAAATFSAYWLAIVVMIYPAGLLMDRIGPVRTTALSFGLLALYPLALAASGDADQLTAATVLYGVAHAGATMGWMLGPVSLAPTPQKVPQYVAIHATLVGVRGIVFQAVGVGLYRLTDSFTWPLIMAAIAYVWSSVQMFQLRARMNRDAANAARS